MANTLYDKGRESFLTGDIDWVNDTIAVALVRGYTPNTATHQFVSNITGAGGTLVATVDLVNKSATNGVAGADDATLSSVPVGSACDHLIFYKNTGVDGTSNLIALIDTAAGLPITPNGADINLVFDKGANRIFKL